MVVSAHPSKAMLWTLIIQFVIVSSAIAHHRTQLPHKCKPKEDRKHLYPSCMQGKDLVLWCDYSNYTSVPDPDTVYTTGKSCNNSIALYLNDSCITGLSKSKMAKYPNIEDFQCGDNFIETLKKEVFSGNGKLKTLNLCFNSISEIEKGAFRGLNKLEILNLTDNSLTTINSRMFHGLTSLKIISFERNQIHVISGSTFTSLPKLEVLFLTGNHISHIDENAFSGLGNLQRLHLDGNELSRLSRNAFTKMPMLKVLTLSYNKFAAMPAFAENSLPNLHTLNFGHNMLESFEMSNVANLSKLQNLSLENNSLHVIPDDLFHNMPNLRFLNLSSNGIEELSECTFSKSCHLEVLSLSNNRLKTPYAEWFTSVIQNGVTEGIDISRNEWNCDCEMVQYNEFFLSKLNSKWLKVLGITCKWPKQYKGESLSDVASNVKANSRCPPFQAVDERPCNSSKKDIFERQTEVFTYQPTSSDAISKGNPTTVNDGYHHEKYEEKPLNIEGILKDKWFIVAAIGAGAGAVLVIAVMLVYVVVKKCRNKYAENNKRNSSSSQGALMDSERSSSRLDVLEVNGQDLERAGCNGTTFIPTLNSTPNMTVDQPGNLTTVQITREKSANGTARCYRSSSTSGSESSRSSTCDLRHQATENGIQMPLIKEADPRCLHPSQFDQRGFQHFIPNQVTVSTT